MKRICMVVGLMFAVPALADRQVPAPHTEDAVIAADEKWGHAEADGDSRYIEDLLLDGYRSIGSGGKVTTKAQIVEGAKKRGKSAEYAKMVADWETKHPSVAHVAIFGDTAVLTWMPTDAGPNPPVNSSDIFVYRDGAWHAIYSQHSTAPEKNP
jgi:Domain of unknown function (DUF4440)